MSPSDQPGSTPPAGQVPPELDPRLKGQQASPSPSPARAPLPIAPMVLGGGVLLTVAILVFGRGGDEVEAAPPEPAPEVAPAEAEAKPLVGSERPEIRHAEAWEKTAEALGAVEKHLNRAQLIFADVDSAMAMSQVPGNQPDWRGGAAVGTAPAEGAQPQDGSAPADGQAVDQAPPEPVEPPGRAEAREIWSSWRSDFQRDLQDARAMMPDPKSVDADLLPGYSAVSELIGACLQIPPGTPPGQNERSAWLNSKKNKAAAVRRTLENAR